MKQAQKNTTFNQIFIFEKITRKINWGGKCEGEGAPVFKAL